jgi:hypothetical protein
VPAWVRFAQTIGSARVRWAKCTPEERKSRTIAPVRTIWAKRMLADVGFVATIAPPRVGETKPTPAAPSPYPAGS